jgi:hypothetical protein
VTSLAPLAPLALPALPASLDPSALDAALGGLDQVASGPDGELDVLAAALNIAGFLAVSTAVSAAAGAGYRWYTRERLPAGLATLFALAAVALSLNTVNLFARLSIPGGGVDPFALETVAFNLVALGGAAALAPAGRALGDRAGVELAAAAGSAELELESEVTGAVGRFARVRAVSLPERVDDIDGYDAVASETKERLAGRTLLVPRRLGPAELRDRVATRIRTDFGVGHVDLDVTDEGVVDYLAVGSRAAGVGHTLAPGSVAVAVRADPPADAGPGDPVQLWRVPEPDGAAGGDGDGNADAAADASDPGVGNGASSTGAAADADVAGSVPAPERVALGELRGSEGDVATVVLDAADADAVHTRERYRLVTMPVEPRADREFAALVRAASERVGFATVTGDGPLAGRAVRDLGATVVAVRPASGPLVVVPAPDRTLAPDDAVYLLGRPESLRRLGAT